MKKNSDSMLDLVFENRNKEYGAYELRANYESRLFKSYGIALLIASLFFLVPFILTKILRHDHAVKALTHEVPVDLYQTFNFEKPKVVIKFSAPVAKSISKVDFKVVRDEEVKPNVDEKKSEVENNSGSTAIGVGIDSSLSSSNVEVASVQPVSDEPMNAAVVDVAPSFPGGEEELYKYFARCIKYPVMARENQLEGTVYASFIIGADGKINKINILRDPGFGMGDEVVRVINKMPAWSPGKYQGKAVKTIYHVPVHFSYGRS